MRYVITGDLLIPASGMYRSHPAAHERDKGKQRNMVSTTFRKHCKISRQVSYTHACTHTYNMHTHTVIQSQSHTHIFTHENTYIYTVAHRHLNTHTHTVIHSHAVIYTHSHTHSHNMHTHNTVPHAVTCTHKHTPSHTHPLSSSSLYLWHPNMINTPGSPPQLVTLAHSYFSNLHFRGLMQLCLLVATGQWWVGLISYAAYFSDALYRWAGLKWWWKLYWNTLSHSLASEKLDKESWQGKYIFKVHLQIRLSLQDLEG